MERQKRKRKAILKCRLGSYYGNLYQFVVFQWKDARRSRRNVIGIVKVNYNNLTEHRYGFRAPAFYLFTWEQ